MQRRLRDSRVGGDEPRPPKTSLPSYGEPTPETHRRLTREEEAEIALTRTSFSPGTATLLVALFLATLAVVPALQLAKEAQAGKLQVFDLFKVLPGRAEIAAVRGASDLWQLLPRADELKSAEKALESESIMAQALLPPVQSFLTGKLRAGNEQVYLGREGWLFYRPDVDYITAPPFLDRTQMKRRAHSAGVEPDPLRAIIQFRDQLAARGIELVVVPAPVKPSIDAEMLAARAPRSAPLQNASFAEFESRLRNAGVRLFDPARSLAERRAAGPQYLATDTHWRPEAMEFVAQQLAAILDLPPAGSAPAPQILPMEISAPGDILRMLKLPAQQQLYRAETVTIRQVNVGNSLWRPSREADVLLLGDSFANIFSLAALGWGESAGFAEHLSAALGGRPLDCILRNSDGAFATREMLSIELARGRDRLAGKKLVVWEFAARELAFGNWKLLDLKLGTPTAARFYTPAPGEEVEVSGTIEALSAPPRPGTVPYTDHVIAIHLTDIRTAGAPQAGSLQSIVYVTSMRDNVWTLAARWRAGDRVSLRLRAWADVSARYEQINRSELDDPALQLEEPVWGELLP